MVDVGVVISLLLCFAFGLEPDPVSLLGFAECVVEGAILGDADGVVAASASNPIRG